MKLLFLGSLFLAGILPGALSAATVDSVAPGGVYSGDETTILIFGSDFPNPDVSVSIEGSLAPSTKRVTSSLLLVDFTSWGYGPSSIVVVTPEGEAAGSLEIERIPKPGDPQELLEQGQRWLADFQEKLTVSYLDALLRTGKTLNLAPSKAVAEQIEHDFHHTMLAEYGAALWCMDRTAGRLYGDISAAGGTAQQLAQFNASFVTAYTKPTELLEYIFTFVTKATQDWQEGPSLKAVHNHLPFELDFSLWLSPLNDTYVRLPESLGIGWTSIRMGGTARLRFQSAPVPAFLNVQGVVTNFVSSPLVVGSIDFGPVVAASNPSNPTVGTLNLATGEIVLQEDYLITTPLLQSLGYPPFPLSFESKGIVSPVSRFRQQAVTRGASAGVTRMPGVVVWGRGLTPSGLPYVGGLDHIALTSCKQPSKPQAPRPTTLTLSVSNSIGLDPNSPPGSPIWRVPVTDGKVVFQLSFATATGTKGKITWDQVDCTYTPPQGGTGEVKVVNFPAKTGTSVAQSFHVLPKEPPSFAVCGILSATVGVEVSGAAYDTKVHKITTVVHFVEGD